MSNKLLTVVIPTKNEDATLLELLSCLELQTFKDFDIIVADSSDTSRVREICTTKNITCLKGGLPGKARNNGVLHTVTEYVLFLDADIHVKKDFIEKALAGMAAKNADCLSFGFKPNTSNLLLRFLHWIAKTYFTLLSSAGFARGIGGAILVKRNAHYSIKGFDESITIAEDHNYLKRISYKNRYAFFTTLTVTLNPRRFYQYGIFTMCIKYFLIETHRLFLREIRHNKIKYFENDFQPVSSLDSLNSEQPKIAND